MKLDLGIRAQLMAGIVLTTLAGIGLIGLFSIKAVESSAIYWKINEAENIVRMLRVALNGQVRGLDRAVMPAYAAEALKAAGIKDFRITDAKGVDVVRAGNLPEEPGERMAYPSDMRVSKLGGGWFRGPGAMLHVIAPLEAQSGNGVIELTLSLKGINEDLYGVKRFLLIYAAVDSVIIIGLGVYFLSRSIIRPVRSLEDAARRISGGKLWERVEVNGGDEIGKLAASFNSMAERLESEIKSLERANIGLMTAQEEVLRSSTLAAVGRLAAGIAHEIGNPLGAVRGYIDILSKGGVDGAEEREIVERASREVERIDLIVREFLELARPSRKPASPVDVNALVGETAADVAVQKDFSGVETTLELAEGLASVIIDEGKLRQVFVNILLNAAHSMQGGGSAARARTVVIRTASEKRMEERPAPRRRKDDQPLLPAAESPLEKEYVTVSISDSGCGMSDEDARRAFDPFFTTKEAGRGTGLGLYVSQGIIKAYGGEISLDTRAGEGTTVTVRLPAGRA